MDTWVIAILLQPLALLVVMALLLPVRIAIFKYFPNLSIYQSITRSNCFMDFDLSEVKAKADVID